MGVSLPTAGRPVAVCVAVAEAVELLFAGVCVADGEASTVDDDEGAGEASAGNADEAVAAETLDDDVAADGALASVEVTELGSVAAGDGSSDGVETLGVDEADGASSDVEVEGGIVKLLDCATSDDTPVDGVLTEAISVALGGAEDVVGTDTGEAGVDGASERVASTGAAVVAPAGVPSDAGRSSPAVTLAPTVGASTRSTLSTSISLAPSIALPPSSTSASSSPSSAAAASACSMAFALRSDSRNDSSWVYPYTRRSDTGQ